MQVYNSVKALVLSTRETSALLPHPACQKCFGEHEAFEGRSHLISLYDLAITFLCSNSVSVCLISLCIRHLNLSLVTVSP